MELNKIYNCNCIDGLKGIKDNSVDLVVTSPPYDDLRSYGDASEWNFEVFKNVANELYRVMKPGCVVVWVVGDQVKNGGETGTSFRQALYFQEIGFKIHDTMIYEKNSSSFPARRDSKRYTQIFEYMFVFVKGKIRNDIKLIADKKNKWSGWTSWGKQTQYNEDGKVEVQKTIMPVPEYSLRNNIWKFSGAFNDKTKHPAVFPEKLAGDNILSWSVAGDVVLDPFMGSGTTAKMCKMYGRYYVGFETNPDYYEESLKRVSKYDDTDSFKNLSKYTVHNIDEDELIVENDDFNEIVEKTKLFNKLVEDLNVYFNEQSLSILKTLKLSFETKANTKRAEERIKLGE